MDAYQILVDKLGKDETEQSINKKISGMSGFLTRDAAIKILYNELKLPVEKVKLSEIAEGANSAKTVAKLARILPLQTFDNGKRMRKVVLSDESGERELKLWNDDVDLLNSIHAGDMLELLGIYCKNNELSLGYSGEMKVLERASFADLGNLPELEGIPVNARGLVESIDGEREYEKDGQKRKMFTFAITDWTGKARVVIWSGVERGRELATGSEVKIENAIARNGELHLNAGSRIMIKRKKQGFGGKVESMEVSDGKLVLVLDGSRHEFAGEDAFRILDAKVAPDIKLETVAELKKDKYVGKNIFVEIKDSKVQQVAFKD